MMDEQNNNLEEFFNKSLEQFNNSPSDMVWGALADRLEMEETFRQRWERKLRRYLPVLLLLLCFGAYFWYAQGKINALHTQMGRMVETNLALQGRLVACGEQQEKSNEPKTTFNTKPNQKIINTTATTPVINPTLATKTIPENNAPIISPAPPTSTTTLQATPKKPAVVPQKPTAAPKPSAPITSISSFSSNFPLAFIAPQSYTSLGVVYVKAIEAPALPSKANYRIGYTARLFNTFISEGRQLSLGSSVGVRQELKLFGAWSLSNAIRFNQQVYYVGSNTGTISPVALARYPGGQEQAAPVRTIKVKSNYFDIPVGLKVTFGHTKKGFRYYVNPSAAWLVYLPQKFDFTLSNNANILERDQRFYGYFGSGNLEVGLEKRIRKNMYWQVGLWAERSFIPLGVEDQVISMFGLSTSFLFGK